MNRTDFQELSDVRIAEAAMMLRGNPPMPDGAYYLAGYAVECALKACIAKSMKEFDWPDRSFVQKCHTHDISTLVNLANLETLRVAAMTTNPKFGDSWDAVKDWDESSRYRRVTLAESRRLFHAVADPVDGVLSWLKAHW